jgi:inorganic pyrophosphatase
VDVVEIGSETFAIGAVKVVKPLGCLAMIDDGELDWKVSVR